MASENEIREELRAMGSPLLVAPRTMPFEVPGGYFEELDAHIKAGIEASESDDPVLDLPAATPFFLPKDYFAESAAQIVSSASLPATDNPYTVPTGYFEGLAARVMDAVKEPAKATSKPKAKIISFPQWRIARVAAAALMVLGIGYGSFKMYYTPDRKASHRLSRVDNEAIGQYVTESIDPLREAPPVNTVTAAVAVKDLSAEEITRYLNETGWEDATTAN